MKNIRYYAFWTMDFFKGSPFRKHYNEIQSIFNGDNGSEEVQQKLLLNLMEYATKNTRYYKKYISESIENFPVLSKFDIISNMDNIFSEEYKNKKETLRTMFTSGSTGTPFKIYQDSDKVVRHKADLLFFYKVGGYSIGDRVYYMRVWTKSNKKSKMNLLKENYKMFDTSNLDNLGANNFVKDMTSDRNKKVILAYASSFIALMEFLEKGGKVDWNIKAIFTQAEELPVKVKKEMQEMFNCPVIARYSNQENGILSQQPSSGENYYELNTASYFIEFLKLDSDEPANEMEEARIVITDLFNKAVPMIRYDTGDVGVYSYVVSKTGNKQKVLHSIKGRINDYMYTNQMEKICPAMISPLMSEYDCIKQYQLIQEDYDEVTLKIVYRDNQENINIQEPIVKGIKQIFGTDTKLTIKTLDSIPIEATGKRRYIISKIDENKSNNIS